MLAISYEIRDLVIGESDVADFENLYFDVLEGDCWDIRNLCLVCNALGEDFPRPVPKIKFRKLLLDQLFHLANYGEL